MSLSTGGLLMFSGVVTAVFFSAELFSLDLFPWFDVQENSNTDSESRCNNERV